MKLIQCRACRDVRLIHLYKIYCKCQQSAGMYLEDHHTVSVSGPCIVIGIANPDLRKDMEDRLLIDEQNQPIRAFVIYSNRVIREDNRDAAGWGKSGAEKERVMTIDKQLSQKIKNLRLTQHGRRERYLAALRRYMSRLQDADKNHTLAAKSFRSGKSVKRMKSA